MLRDEKLIWIHSRSPFKEAGLIRSCVVVHYVIMENVLEGPCSFLILRSRRVTHDKVDKKGQIVSSHHVFLVLSLSLSLVFTYSLNF